jgi:hypothetical protein
VNATSADSDSNAERLKYEGKNRCGSCVVFTPSIVPSSDDTVYIVEDDFGEKLGRVFRETDSAQCDRETALQDLYSGQYNDPIRVIAFNTREGWSRDVSYEFAAELQRRADVDRRELTGGVADFIEFYTRPARQLSLRLA